MLAALLQPTLTAETAADDHLAFLLIANEVYVPRCHGGHLRVAGMLCDVGERVCPRLSAISLISFCSI